VLDGVAGLAPLQRWLDDPRGGGECLVDAGPPTGEMRRDRVVCNGVGNPAVKIIKRTLTGTRAAAARLGGWPTGCGLVRFGGGLPRFS
jgi:hypothetical protein